MVRVACDAPRVRIEQTFDVAGAGPESVFDYMTNPANLQAWQTSKTRVEVLSEGEPRAGYRVREWTKVPAIDGTWELSPEDGGTRVRFTAEGPLQGPMRLLEPIVRRAIDRQFHEYHDNLRRNVEAQG
jgi:carbon monoxide dehydrogenase subunit G